MNNSSSIRPSVFGGDEHWNRRVFEQMPGYFFMKDREWFTFSGGLIDGLVVSWW